MAKEIPKDRDCFVCGNKNPIGLDVDFEVNEDKSVSARFTPKKHFMGFKDVLHGGIISAVLDDAMDWAIYAKTDKLFITSTMTVNFKKPASPGEELQVHAICDYDGGKVKKVQTARATLKDSRGNTIATSEGKFFEIPKGKEDEITCSFG